MIKSIFIKQFFILSILTCLIVCSDDTVDPTNNSHGDSNTDGNSSTCGDGVLNAYEACDDGTSNSDILANACRTNCTIASCGDSVCDTDEDSSTCSNDCPSITHISLAENHTCVIRNGELYCWGYNSRGQLGDGTNGVDYNDTSADKNIPTRIGNNSDWTHISSGAAHTCAIRNGELFCWGNNENGQLGNGTNATIEYDTSADKNIPTRIGNNSDWTHISLGGSHTCAIRDGELFCWGNNENGQLGDETNTDKNIPTRIGNNSDWTHISSGYYHTCGMRNNNGELYCWGDNAYGQLGDETNGENGYDPSTDKNIPTRIGNNPDWTHISSGYYHTCGMRNNSGELYCWGHNAYGQLGDGTNGLDYNNISADKNIPTRIGNNSDWVNISSGSSHTCGLRNRELFCWGHNYKGQLGDGTSGTSYSDTTTDKNTPTPIDDKSDWTHISSGGSHTCGLRNGELFCWGRNNKGQLGDGTNANKNTPTLISF